MSKFTRISATLPSYALQATLETLIIDFFALISADVGLFSLTMMTCDFFFSLENYDATMLHSAYPSIHKNVS